MEFQDIARFAIAIAATTVACNKSQEPPKTPYEQEYARCMRYGGSSPMICRAVANQKAGPQEAALGDAAWAAHEAAARDVLGAEGGSATVHRVQNVGFMAEQRLALRGGHCYRVGVSWPEKRATRASVVYVPGEDGVSPHERLRTREFDLPQTAGTVAFCADHDGEANLTFTALDPSGVIINRARLEYAIAVTERGESAEERAERHALEDVKVADARVRIEMNLQSADQRKGGDAFAAGCARCRKALYACVEQEDADDQGCVDQFELCAQPLGMNEGGRVLCGAP